MKIKTGIFGGSFNPIHIGHLALANYLCEFGEIDELWFMISPKNPLKQQADLLSDELRLAMVKAAIKGYSKFHASDFEFNLPRPSYTIDTIDLLKRSYPDREFYLIIGSDNWAVFNKWKENDRLINENKVIIYPRPEYPVNESQLPQSVKLMNVPLLEISSTFIREAFRGGKDIRYFLHPEVYKLFCTSF